MPLRSVCHVIALAITLFMNSAAHAQEAAPPLPDAADNSALPLLEEDIAPKAEAAKPAQAQRRPAPRPSAPTTSPQPWKPLFFDNDFSYMSKPNAPSYCGEELKLLPFEVCDCPWTISYGGQIRHRYADEVDRLRPPGPGDNTYQLWRLRNYVDLRGDVVRVYVEGIDAEIFGEEFPPLAIDRNRWDLLNAFVDVELYDDGDTTGVLRYGRQELLYGSQRLVSPLDWSNTRRNFEGAKYIHTTGDWRLDAFVVNPVNAAADNGPAAKWDASFDQPDANVRFHGLYSSYTGIENTTLDTYYLYLHDEEAVRNEADGHRSTAGTRLAGTVPLKECERTVRSWDYDLEGAYQFGSDNSQRVDAWFAVGEVGHTWNAMPWSPRIAGLYYYGSGDHDPGDGTTNTFDVSWPLGHAYWGIIDNLSGQNLIWQAARFSAKPTTKMLLSADYHWFDRATDDDFVYTLSGAPFGPASGSRDVGDEVDLIATYTFSPNLSVQLGYARFFYGPAVEDVSPRDDGQLFYTMTTLNY